MRLIEQDTSYVEQRADAVQDIESHISDLQGVFGKLASLISDQRQDAVRIDENTSAALDAVEAGQGELLTTLNNLQVGLPAMRIPSLIALPDNFLLCSQSGKIFGMKVFAVLFMFAIFFIFFVL